MLWYYILLIKENKKNSATSTAIDNWDGQLPSENAERCASKRRAVTSKKICPSFPPPTLSGAQKKSKWQNPKLPRRRRSTQAGRDSGGPRPARTSIKGENSTGGQLRHLGENVRLHGWGGAVQEALQVGRRHPLLHPLAAHGLPVPASPHGRPSPALSRANRRGRHNNSRGARKIAPGRTKKSSQETETGRKESNRIRQHSAPPCYSCKNRGGGEIEARRKRTGLFIRNCGLRSAEDEEVRGGAAAAGGWNGFGLLCVCLAWLCVLLLPLPCRTPTQTPAIASPRHVRWGRPGPVGGLAWTRYVPRAPLGPGICDSSIWPNFSLGKCPNIQAYDCNTQDI